MTVLIIGWTGSPNGLQPECLYCGVDGVKANEVAGVARETGKFTKIGKLVNPSVIPMACVPFPKPQAVIEDSQKTKTKKVK